RAAARGRQPLACRRRPADPRYIFDSELTQTRAFFARTVVCVEPARHRLSRALRWVWAAWRALLLDLPRAPAAARQAALRPLRRADGVAGAALPRVRRPADRVRAG